MISIRGGAGLGDALYVQAVARHLVGQGHRVEACSKYADVFRPLGGKVVVSPFRRERIDRIAHYSLRRSETKTDQFEDCCIQAGIAEPVELRLDWGPSDPVARGWLDGMRRPIVLVQTPREPMDRDDRYGIELLPDCNVLQRVIDRVGAHATLIQVGLGPSLYRDGERLVPGRRLTGIDCDVTNRTSVIQLLDLAHAADAFLGYVSFMVPLAAALGKPALWVWSRRGLNSRNEIIRWLTPRKVLHGPLNRVVVDDCPEGELTEAADALCRQIRSLRAA